MSEIKMEIELTPDSYDSDKVRFLLNDEQVGYGYRGKKDQVIRLMSCPQCRRENYALQRAASGSCAFCGFDPNI